MAEHNITQDYEELQAILDQVSVNTGDIAALSNKFTSGTWTPTVSRATLTSSSGKWYKIGDIVFLTAIITFAASQTDSGNLYIDGSSLPAAVTASNVSIHGAAGTGSHSHGITTFANKNMWISRDGSGRIQATTLAGETLYCSMTAVPR